MRNGTRARTKPRGREDYDCTWGKNSRKFAQMRNTEGGGKNNEDEYDKKRAGASVFMHVMFAQSNSFINTTFLRMNKICNSRQTDRLNFEL